MHQLPCRGMRKNCPQSRSRNLVWICWTLYRSHKCTAGMGMHPCKDRPSGATFPHGTYLCWQGSNRTAALRSKQSVHESSLTLLCRNFSMRMCLLRQGSILEGHQRQGQLGQSPQYISRSFSEVHCHWPKVKLFA